MVRARQEEVRWVFPVKREEEIKLGVGGNRRYKIKER